jgi:ankyrin repeat protein
MVRKQPKRKPRPGVDEYGRTPLHYAALDADLARVRELLAGGANPGAAADDGWTPLHFAAQAYAPEICEALLRAGAPVDPADSYGNTPLWRAVFDSQGRGEAIAVLRRHGANPLRANAHAVSPLGLARTIANYDVEQFFADLRAQSPTSGITSR